MHQTKEKLETVPYYDVINFARELQSTGTPFVVIQRRNVSTDIMHVANNVISATKELFPALETGHWTYPERRTNSTPGWRRN